MKYHKERGTLWIALIDPDEYITFNILSDDDRDPEWKNDVDVFDLMDRPDSFTQMEYTRRVQTHNLRREMTDTYALLHQTVWDYIHQYQHKL